MVAFRLVLLLVSVFLLDVSESKCVLTKQTWQFPEKTDAEWKAGNIYMISGIEFKDTTNSADIKLYIIGVDRKRAAKPCAVFKKGTLKPGPGGWITANCPKEMKGRAGFIETSKQGLRACGPDGKVWLAGRLWCPPGQVAQNGVCRKVNCPAGQTMKGNKCEPIKCPRGQVLKGSKCEPIECPTGQVLKGSKCKPIKCPAGQVLKGSKCEPSCPANHTKVGGKCAKCYTKIVSGACQAGHIDRQCLAKPAPGVKCVLPFKYEGKLYWTCTKDFFHRGRNVGPWKKCWCGTKADATNMMYDGSWAHCDGSPQG